jgi:hypothetical protein
MLAESSSKCPIVMRIPSEVEEQLRIYVYAYIDPRNHRTFYIGKGRPH